MNDFTSKLIKTLAETGDARELFREHIEIAINKLLQIELTEFLDYEPYDRNGFNTGNNRNGFYERLLETEYGTLKLKVPRDRNGEFTNQTLTPYKRRHQSLEHTVIHLYQRGMTTQEISTVIERLYGHHYSKQTVSNITQAVNADLEAFINRPLASRYAVVYLDATYLPIRRDTVAKEAVYFAVGITPDGTKEILLYRVFPTESAHSWKLMLTDLKAKGMEKSLLFVTDGLSGIKDAISEIYPHALHQSCWVHLSRNVSHNVRVKDRVEVLEDLKRVYTARDEAEGQKALNDFVLKWRKAYGKMVDSLKRNESLFKFMRFPESIRKSLYTTNLVEGMHKHLKRYTKRKEQFPNEDALLRFIVTQANNYNQRYAAYTHRGFQTAKPELEAMFEKLERDVSSKHEESDVIPEPFTQTS